MVRRNQIPKNGLEAIWVRSGAKGTYEDNDLRNNARGPGDIENGANIKRSGNIDE